jgi:hypothetical protein
MHGGGIYGINKITLTNSVSVRKPFIRRQDLTEEIRIHLQSVHIWPDNILNGGDHRNLQGIWCIPSICL